MTTIGPNIKVEGQISGDEDLTIYGRVDGTLTINANVVVAENGQIHGTLIAKEVIVLGHVQGTINASTLLVLEQSARVVANIETASLRMEAGAQLSGDVIMDVEGEVPKRPQKKTTSMPAPPKAKAPAPKPKPAPKPVPVVEIIDEDEYEEIEDLNELTVKELRELCQDYDLSTKGTKAQLIKRLEESE